MRTTSIANSSLLPVFTASFQLFGSNYTHRCGPLYALRSIYHPRNHPHIQTRRHLTDILGPTEGLVLWTSTQVSLGSRPAFHPLQQIIKLSLLTNTSPYLHTPLRLPQSPYHSLSFILRLQLKSPVTASSTTVQYTTYPDSLTSRSPPSLHKSYNTPRSFQ